MTDKLHCVVNQSFTMYPDRCELMPEKYKPKTRSMSVKLGTSHFILFVCKKIIMNWSIIDWVTKVKEIKLDLRINLLILFTGLPKKMLCNFFLTETFMNFTAKPVRFH